MRTILLLNITTKLGKLQQERRLLPISIPEFLPLSFWFNIHDFKFLSIHAIIDICNDKGATEWI